jgi:predicted phage terminase large subunit-like protein
MDNGVKSLRKNMEFRYNNSEFLQEWIPKATFTDNYIEFRNRENQPFGLKMFGAKTGLRGTKIFGKRPVIAVLDDLVSDDDAKSKAAMLSIKDTVYKGVDYALDPSKRKIIFNGTPFDMEDILIEAVESGAWDVNVWPVCERFPCTEEEFSGAWEDRFTYEYVKRQYDDAVLNGKVSAFMQELMLRITSAEERLVQDSEIRWYSRQKLLASKESFNYYVTTDFATSAKQTADYSVISVWAYNANGDWFWVDGICERQTIDKTWDDLFRLVQEYRPQQVGIEVTGQQQAYIRLLQTEMMHRNIWFNFASSEKSNEAGIRPTTDKLTRFNLVVPWFKTGKMYWPEEMKTSNIVGTFLNQIRLVTQSGIKGKDDCIDTISMLGYLKPWKPSDSMPVTKQEVSVWEETKPNINVGGLSSYIV